jgi:hypothetical protein
MQKKAKAQTCARAGLLLQHQISNSQTIDVQSEFHTTFSKALNFDSSQLETKKFPNLGLLVLFVLFENSSIH